MHNDVFLEWAAREHGPSTHTSVGKLTQGQLELIGQLSISNAQRTGSDLRVRFGEQSRPILKREYGI